MKKPLVPQRSVREEAAIGPRILKDPHSVEFAWQTVNWLKGRFHSLTVSEQHWKAALAEAEQYQIYTRVPPEQPYGSMNAMLQAEIGMDTETSIITVKARMQKAAQHTTGEVLPVGAPKGNNHAAKDKKQKDDSSLCLLSRRAKENGVSRQTQQRLDRLAREAPAYLAKVQTGELTVHRACIEAGHIKESSSLDKVVKAYRKLTPSEQRQFHAIIHT